MLDPNDVINGVLSIWSVSVFLKTELMGQPCIPLYHDPIWAGGLVQIVRCKQIFTYSLKMILEALKIDGTIHEKLEKEANSLSHLKETLNRSSYIAQGMTSILTSFEDRLAKLEQTILPVYNETENLQQRQENIEKTLASLDHVISYYNVSNDVEHVIKDGPTCGLEIYLESIDKIQASIKYFEVNNPQSPELQNLTTLFDTAGDALHKEFRALLTRYSKPVPVVTILDLISADEELGTEEDKVMIEHLPEKTISELTRIAAWLIENGRDDFTVVYQNIRASILLRSLQCLKDHHKSASGSSTSMLPIHGSPALSRARPKDPAAKPSKKLPQAINKASKKIMNFSQSVEQATGIALGHRRQGSCIDLKDEVMDNDMEFYQACVTALHKLMQSELKLMHSIIPPEHWKNVFEHVVHPGLDLIVQEGENIATKAKKCVGRHDFLGVLTVFPIIKHLITLKPEIDQLLQNCQPTICNKFACVIDTLQSMGIRALEDFIESIKNDMDRQMPKDGTVHELTSNVMMFLEQLLDYVDIVGTLLPENKQATTGTPNLPAYTDKRKVTVGYYMLRVLTMLNLALTNKSETYSDGFLKPIFRMNNLHYILKSLQRTGLLDVVQCFSRDVEKHYNDLIREQKRLYSQSWSRVLHYVLEVDKPLQLTSAKLKDRDRQSIKDKFTGFNKEMDDIYKTQKGYAIPDVELRESLKRENKCFIQPKYEAFYEKYRKVPFTKNTGKYIKYTPVEVGNLLERFFDVAA